MGSMQLPYDDLLWDGCGGSPAVRGHLKGDGFHFAACHTKSPAQDDPDDDASDLTADYLPLLDL